MKLLDALMAELDDVREQWEHEAKTDCQCDECRDAERERQEMDRLYEQTTGGPQW